MKLLDISQHILDFENKPIDNGGTPMTLKTALLGYFQNCTMMGLDFLQKANAYEAARIIGAGTGEIELVQPLYDITKYMCDLDEINVQGVKSPVFLNFAIGPQVKRMVDAAKTKESK